MCHIRHCEIASSGFATQGASIRIEKRSEDVTKTKLWNYGIAWHIQKEQDEKCSLAKNQPVRANWWGDKSNVMFPMTPYKSFYLRPGSLRLPFKPILQGFVYIHQSRSTRQFVLTGGFFGKDLFHLFLSEYASQSQNFANLNFCEVTIFMLLRLSPYVYHTWRYPCTPTYQLPHRHLNWGRVSIEKRFLINSYWPYIWLFSL